jgi:iron(III) transport system substrate-binding protein
MTGPIPRLAVAAAFCLIAGTGHAQTPDWIMPDILEAAKAEGGVTVYSSVNESEALPQWKLFEDATGIKVTFVRASDVAINSRIAIEGRAQARSWDLTITTAVSQLPRELVAAYELPQASALIPQARAADRRWYGSSANYNTPAYNTKLLQKSELPASYEALAQRKDLRGRVAIDRSDGQWLAGMFQHYGEARGRQLMNDIIANVDPIVVDGHLALARSVGAGEYAMALNNFINLTFNVRMSGAPTDIFALDPVAVHMVQVGMSARAPHPNAARLAANFIISQQGQAFAAKFGRVPVRGDVSPNPPDALAQIAGKTIVATSFDPEAERKWRRTFDELFRPR